MFLSTECLTLPATSGSAQILYRTFYFCFETQQKDMTVATHHFEIEVVSQLATEETI